jgi:hypothetical protein
LQLTARDFFNEFNAISDAKSALHFLPGTCTNSAVFAPFQFQRLRSAKKPQISVIEMKRFAFA